MAITAFKFRICTVHIFSQKIKSSSCRIYGPSRRNTLYPATYASSTAIPKIGKTSPLTTTLLRQAVRFVREYTNKYYATDNLGFFIGLRCLGSYMNYKCSQRSAHPSVREWGKGRNSTRERNPGSGRKADQKIFRSTLELRPKKTFISTS